MTSTLPDDDSFPWPLNPPRPQPAGPTPVSLAFARFDTALYARAMIEGYRTGEQYRESGWPSLPAYEAAWQEAVAELEAAKQAFDVLATA